MAVFLFLLLLGGWVGSGGGIRMRVGALCLVCMFKLTNDTSSTTMFKVANVTN